MCFMAIDRVVPGNMFMCNIWMCVCVLWWGLRPCVLGGWSGISRGEAAAKECSSGKGQGKSFHLGSVLCKSETANFPSTLPIRQDVKCSLTTARSEI